EKAFRAAIGCWMALSCQFLATADTVRTKEGQVYRGGARLVPGGIQVAITNELAVTVVLSNLQSAVVAEAGGVIAGEHRLRSVSDDGHNWKVVGSQTIALSPTRNRDDQWYIGLVASSHSNGAFCTAVFDQVEVRSAGLKVDFFSDDFKTLLKTEILARLDRVW